MILSLNKLVLQSILICIVTFYEKYILLLLLFSFSSSKIYATHIVGGDFKVTMTSNGTNSSVYDIQLRLYRDDVMVP